MGYESYIGQISLYGFNYAPHGEAMCQGQQMNISQNSALYALLGTTYGGNGSTTFNLPDLRGRVAVGFGQGPGLSGYQMGQMGGAESVTLTVNQMPAHNHMLAASGSANAATPVGNFIASATDPNGDAINAFNSASSGQMNAGAIAPAGGSQGHNNMQPYLVLNYCINLQGIFPSRS